VRLGGRISWLELQPNPGDPIRWELLTNFESELRLLKQSGITPVVIINHAPRWATILPTSCSAIRSDMFPAFAHFVRAKVIGHGRRRTNAEKTNYPRLSAAIRLQFCGKSEQLLDVCMLTIPVLRAIIRVSLLSQSV
jgi:hypothetical protein